MRKLVDLEAFGVAVITWWERNVFDPEKETRFRDLVWNKHRTEEEAQELAAIGKETGRITVAVDAIQFHSGHSMRIQTGFQLNGFHFRKIQAAIEELENEYKDKTVSYNEGVVFPTYY